jgi:uncharacterized membrane protein
MSAETGDPERSPLAVLPYYIPVGAELGTIGLATIAGYVGVKVYGKQRATYFLAGSILWTSIIENLGVIDKSYTYYTYAGLFGPGYPGYLLWVGQVPLWIELGWVIVAISLFVLFHEVLLPGRSPFLQAALAGFFAVNVDLVIDPVAVANNLWQWINPSVYVLGVPIYNFLGWFCLIFFYDLLFNYTILQEKPVAILGRIERVFLRDRYTLAAKTARFAFRLVVTILLVAILLTVVAEALLVVSQAGVAA